MPIAFPVVPSLFTRQPYATKTFCPSPGRFLLGALMTLSSTAATGVAALSLVSQTARAEEGSWTATSLANAPLARDLHTAVWTGSRMIVWGGNGYGGASNTGALYDPATDTWTPTSAVNAPSARDSHSAVWTGSRMIVWGGAGGSGYLDTGALYDPTTDTWTSISTTNAPSARGLHTAVWTGSRMIIWGGVQSGLGSYLNTGAAYDPTTDTWTPTSTVNTPSARRDHTAVWTGSRMIAWGGYVGAGISVSTGAAYDPSTDTWATTGTVDAPSLRRDHTAAWTGSRMVIWGGNDGTVLLNTGAAYDLATDAWTPTSTVNPPSMRFNHTAVWTGSSMIVWGGYGYGGYLNTGAAYDPTTDTWTPTSAVNGPSGRDFYTAVWTGSRMIVWGGLNLGGYLNTGGLYSDASPPPSPTAFFTLTPCRVVDTRRPEGATGGPALAASSVRTFPVTGGACGVPSSARAISVNLAAVEPTAPGYLTLFPGDAAGSASTSSLNFSMGQTRANNAVVLLATDGAGTIKVKNGAAGSVHFVLDVNGYLQ